VAQLKRLMDDHRRRALNAMSSSQQAHMRSRLPTISGGPHRTLQVATEACSAPLFLGELSRGQCE